MKGERRGERIGEAGKRERKRRWGKKDISIGVR